MRDNLTWCTRISLHFPRRCTPFQSNISFENRGLCMIWRRERFYMRKRGEGKIGENEFFDLKSGKDSPSRGRGLNGVSLRAFSSPPESAFTLLTARTRRIAKSATMLSRWNKTFMLMWSQRIFVSKTKERVLVRKNGRWALGSLKLFVQEFYLGKRLQS